MLMGLPNIRPADQGLFPPGLHMAVTTMSCFFQEVKGQRTLWNANNRLRIQIGYQGDGGALREDV